MHPVSTMLNCKVKVIVCFYIKPTRKMSKSEVNGTSAPEAKINLTTIKRSDQYINHIVSTTSHVEVYKFDDSARTWVSCSLAWPDPIPRRGVIAFSISAPLGKGSGTLHSVHSYPSQRISLSVD